MQLLILHSAIRLSSITNNLAFTPAHHFCNLTQSFGIFSKHFQTAQSLVNSFLSQLWRLEYIPGISGLMLFSSSGRFAHLSDITSTSRISSVIWKQAPEDRQFCQSQRYHHWRDTRQSRTTANCRNEKCSCLPACSLRLTQFFFTDLPAFGIKINDLTADHRSLTHIATSRTVFDQSSPVRFVPSLQRQGQKRHQPKRQRFPKPCGSSNGRDDIHHHPSMLGRSSWISE